MVNKKKKIELLCPAKNFEAGMAAISHGADAVYTGAGRFGARKAAGNSLADIEKLVQFAHRYYASVYITLNTVLFEHELEDARKLVFDLYNAGVDAFIIQDMAFFEMELPPVALHMSTQCHNNDIGRIGFLEGAGAERVILARELPVDEIRRIREKTHIELEAFIHGALCVSYSGQCYMSLAAGGRSANRGECAQPCRKKYSLYYPDGKEIIHDRHLLCLKDMNRSDSLSEMIDAGITSFKIEGRLKDINYVKNVTAFYRKRLDIILEEKPSCFRKSSGVTRHFFEPDLSKTFNRGYTDYFFPGCRKSMLSPLTPKSIGTEAGKVIEKGNGWIQIGSELGFSNGDGFCFFNKRGELSGFRGDRAEDKKIFGSIPDELEMGTDLYRNHDAAFFDMLKSKTSLRKVMIDVILREHEQGLEIIFTDEDKNSVKDILLLKKEKALNPEKSYDAIKKSFSKLGDTIFELREFSIEFDTIYSIRPSELNAVRRSLAESLLKERLLNYPKNEVIREKKHPACEKTIGKEFNVTNSMAEQFYTCCGAKSVLRGYDQSLDPELRVMTTKLCLRNEFGLCRGKNSNNGPLILRDDKNTYRLEFDCENCLMKIII